MLLAFTTFWRHYPQYLQCGKSKPTIQIQEFDSNIYNHRGAYITTIPSTRLQWSWDKLIQNKTHHMANFLQPSPQDSGTKILWLAQWYITILPKKITSKNITPTTTIKPSTHGHQVLMHVGTHPSIPLRPPLSIHPPIHPSLSLSHSLNTQTVSLQFCFCSSLCNFRCGSCNQDILASLLTACIL